VPARFLDPALMPATRHCLHRTSILHRMVHVFRLLSRLVVRRTWRQKGRLGDRSRVRPRLCSRPRVRSSSIRRRRRRRVSSWSPAADGAEHAGELSG
jgi:hypothetical protein